MRLLALTAAAALLAACSTVEVPGPGAKVFARLETPAVGTANADAADDPAIWASRAPITIGGVTSQGFVAGTDKKAGLYIYALDGQVMQFLPEGLLNNVDLIDGFRAGGRDQVLIGASDRGAERMGVSFFLYEPGRSATVAPWGVVPFDVSEPYGFCFGRRDGQVHAFLVSKDGEVVQSVVTEGADGKPAARIVRRFQVGSISEGCAVDEASDSVFVNEEMVGVWRYGFDPASGDARTQIQAVDGERLTADVEGATILIDGTTRYLIASSQGDSGFAVWRLDAAGPTWIGRFAVHDGVVDGVTGTDGLDALGGRVGDAFPEGLIVVQDDVNPGGAQNFKYVDWRDVKAALGL